ncbi:MAG: hypothetical protein R3E11_00785 [Sphingobium sp.]
MLRELIIVSIAVASCLLTDDRASGATSEPAPVVKRFTADEARQGVASDGAYFYAIDNSRIGKYRIDTGEKVAEWQGDAEAFPHINSCTVIGTELACATSNYPAVPQTSLVEFFSLSPLQHLRSVALADMPGSLTAMDRHDGHWWGVFANYDTKGSPAGKDHRDTYLVKLDDAFQPLKAWTFPEDVLARFAPSSCSGMAWTDAGALLASGHDKPEVYVLSLPEAGTVLRHAATIPVISNGQAIDVDPVEADLLWSIDRATKTVIASTIAPQDF